MEVILHGTSRKSEDDAHAVLRAICELNWSITSTIQRALIEVSGVYTPVFASNE